MSRIETLPSVPPMPAVSRILARHDRQSLAAFIAVAIDLLDTMDGDPDAETGNDVEDDFELTENAVERATSDPGVDCADRDAGSYVEWHTLHGRQKGGQCQMAGHEDDEEDDPDTAVEDDPRGFDPEQDYGVDDVGEQDEAEGGLTPDYAMDQTNCLPVPMVLAADRDAMKSHKARIRDTRCEKVVRYGYAEYRLRDPEKSQ